MDTTTARPPRNQHEQRQFLRTMLNFMPIPALLVEPESGEVRFANAAADEAAGGAIPRTAPCKHDPAWGTIATATGAPLADEDFPRARLARGERLRQFELQWQLPSGTHHLLLSGGKLPPIGDEPSLIVLMFEDISYLKQIESELRAANRRKDEFLATLAHELRNPLMPIRNALAVLARADSREVAEHARGMMERQVSRMTRLIDDLLDLSRITRGKISLQREPVELQRAVENAIETTQPLFSASKQRIKLTLPPQPIRLDADLTRLEQVLTNLLTNANRYTQAGGEIRLTVAAEDGEAVVRIRDNGIGIPRNKLLRIFDMFSQVEDKHGRTRSGLGIGLTLVRQLVELHGGSVKAASEGPGKGSEFEVRLPRLADDDTANPPPPDAPPSRPTSRHRALVVDDNHDVADSLGMMLELMECDVRIAYDGFSALDMVADFQPHVVFLDVGLPELDGYEIARRLRAQPGNDGIMLVALTGWGQEHHKERARQAGFDRHFVKPADPADIEKLLAEIRPA
ncbi:MAG TPA: ATP-binding protein [Gammaproteobacteria bacterium]|nr:ATP-binding protein [Gammaproteobacteria bacterium]